MRDRPPTSDAERVELFDRLWNDPRRRDDRSEFHECEHCGRAVRWVANVGSRHGSSLPIVAQLVTTAAFFDAERHRGLVAVAPDRTGFTVSRFTTRDDIEDSFLYQCHWDVCDDARRVRDRLSGERRARDEAQRHGELEAEPHVVHGYEAWRRSQPR